MKMTFEPEAATHVLSAFGATTDEEGFIVDRESGDRVTTPDGESITVDELAMIEHGSNVFVDDNFASLVDHVERNRDTES